MKGTTLIRLTSEELQILIGVLEYQFSIGFGDEEVCELHEKLKDMEVSNAGN
ncbi:hypothetical protein M2263_000143 [Providencia alcalifaciens]|nr:hypothetical protein [Providencia alcalifaciens]